MKWKCKNGKVEAKTKSEKAERELEGKLPPFFWFFLVVFLCVLSSLCLRKRKKKQQHDFLFFV
jgi:hypothetical protein